MLPHGRPLGLAVSLGFFVNALGLFAAESDLKLSGKKNPAVAAPAALEVERGVAPRVKPQKIRLELQDGQTVQDGWDAYFADLKAAPEEQRTAVGAAVRVTASDMFDHQQYAELIALIQAALRHGFPQTWMYEGLGLAMKASGAPIDEVERALMSSVDFANNLDDVMYVAVYMTHLGLDARALKLYREVAGAQPFRPEPYMQGLAAAQRLDDLAGIKWACVGILRQAWTKEDQTIADSVKRTTKATYEKLVAEKLQAEADEFKQQVERAMIRDCVIRINWTGEADIDLVVEEPSGAVCSARDPRSTAGGVMLGDTYPRVGDESAVGYSEYYVCPEGFAGQYRILLKRIWGRPTAGKVTVDIITHSGTPQQQSGRQQITVGEKDAAIVFKLDQGRRVEPLDGQQIANVARAQEAISRNILTQQLSASEDSGATRDYLRSALEAERVGRLPRRNAVGVRPEITVLPEGTNFNATAVISADRRYVRVTPMPLFSAIGDVTTFQVTGDPGAAGGGGGAGGGGIGGGALGGQGGQGGGLGGGGMF